jgi:circadian clock protein KaiC
MGTEPIGVGDRAESGVEGLDDILGGGFPRSRMYLVQGEPGAGKTTLALQFLLQGERAGEGGLYITLSETRDELESVAAAHGWSIAGINLLEMSAVEDLLGAEAQTTVFHSSEVELNAVAGLIRDTAGRTRPGRLVFDSLSDLRLLAETPLRYRRQLLDLKRFFAGLGCTVLLLDDRNFSPGGSDPHVLSLAHGVLDLEQLAPEYGAARRRLQVRKLRGVAYRGGYHDYVIETGGLRAFPRLVAGEHHAVFVPHPVASGIPALDALFAGGIDRGTTTLIMGPAGTGKSSIALLYLRRFAECGDRGLFFSFDETLAVALARARALGFGLDDDIAAGRVMAHQVDPAELSPGEFTSRVRAGVAAGATFVVLDSLNGYLHAMPGERYLYSHLHELFSYLNERGVATMLLLAQHGALGAPESPVDLSYLADMVVSLRYFELDGAVRRVIAVLKKRSGAHESTIREFRLVSGEGLTVGPPLTGFQGLLTGEPKRLEDAGRAPSG